MREPRPKLASFDEKLASYYASQAAASSRSHSTVYVLSEPEDAAVKTTPRIKATEGLA